jgi:hypothetical protein
MPSPKVQATHCDEAEDLLSALRGSNDQLWDGIPEHWVFRGHAEATWDLLPSALRAKSGLTHHPNRPRGPYSTAREQLEREALVVFQFAEMANRRGLPVPGGWTAARRELSGHADSANTFPPANLWDLFALAQHHGVPTRLLDWSRAPLTAAYFAAHGAAQMMNDGVRKEGQKLGIWALNTTALWNGSASESEAVHLIDPPRFGNRNLIAQDGVFTLHRHACAPDASPLCESLDTVVTRLHLANGSSGIGQASIRLLTLPARKARKVLARLESEQINASTLFPGYGGVVRALAEQLSHSDSDWRSPPREE